MGLVSSYQPLRTSHWFTLREHFTAAIPAFYSISYHHIFRFSNKAERAGCSYYLTWSGNLIHHSIYGSLLHNTFTLLPIATFININFWSSMGETRHETWKVCTFSFMSTVYFYKACHYYNTAYDNITPRHEENYFIIQIHGNGWVLEIQIAITMSPKNLKNSASEYVFPTQIFKIISNMINANFRMFAINREYKFSLYCAHININ